HVQDDRGQGSAQNFWVSKLWAGGKVLFRVQPDGNAGAGASCPAGALLSRGLRDPLDGQTLHFRALGIPGDPCGTGIDDVFDTRDGQGGFGNVGGYNNALPLAGTEDPLLILQGEAIK